MQIKDIMTKQPTFVTPETTIQEAAAKMEQLNTGSLLVGENEKLIGFITDRDITTRCVAKGFNPATTTVGQCCSNQVLYFFEDQTVEEATQNMEQNKILRLVVVDRNKQLKGILAHSDIAQAAQQNTSEQDNLQSCTAELASFAQAA